MKPVVLAVLACACGRVGFSAPPDAARDAAAPDATPEVPRVIAVSTGVASATLSFPLALTPNAPGNVLIAGVTMHSNASVLSIATGAGDSFVSANARAVMNGTASEVWYLADAPVENQVTVTIDSSSGFDLWVAEFTGVAAAAPLVATNEGCLTFPPTVATEPVTTTVPNELVFGVSMLAAPADVDTVAPPFIALLVQSGNGAAYSVPASPGSYGPSWTASPQQTASTCSSTAAFAPGP